VFITGLSIREENYLCAKHKIPSHIKPTLHERNFHSCTVHLDVIKSFISPTNAQIITLKY